MQFVSQPPPRLNSVVNMILARYPDPGAGGRIAHAPDAKKAFEAQVAEAAPKRDLRLPILRAWWTTPGGHR